MEDFRKNKNGIDQGNFSLQNDISEGVCRGPDFLRVLSTSPYIKPFICKSLYYWAVLDIVSNSYLAKDSFLLVSITSCHADFLTTSLFFLYGLSSQEPLMPALWMWVFSIALCGQPRHFHLLWWFYLQTIWFQFPSLFPRFRPDIWNPWQSCVHAPSLQLCATLCDPMDCSLP